MKIVTKIMLIIAGAALVMGLILMSLTYVLIGGNLKKLNTGNTFEKKEYTMNSSEVDNLEIDLDSNELEIYGTNTDEIHITYYENETQKYEIENKEKSLVIHQLPIHKISFFVMNFDFESYSMKIEMPKELVGKLMIDNHSGSVRIDDLSVGKDMQINISSGSLKMNNIRCAQNMDVLASSGSVKIYDSAVAENGKFDLSSGSLKMENFEANNLEVNVSSGSAKLSDVKAGQSIRCDAKSGLVEITDIDAGEKITISAESGSIKGSIIGKMSDFTIHSEASNGDCNLPDRMEGGSKQLDVSAQSGNIRIGFSEAE